MNEQLINSLRKQNKTLLEIIDIFSKYMENMKKHQEELDEILLSQ